MSETRINPETGVIEERCWHGWVAQENDDGRETRVNQETGVHEEHRWHGWTASENANRREERTNPETGVREEHRWHGWTSVENNNGREERVNRDTGVHEEHPWHGWSPSESDEGREERTNPDSGVHEERRWHGWTPKEGSHSPPRHVRSRSSSSSVSFTESSDSSSSTETYSSDEGSGNGSSSSSSSSFSFGAIVFILLVLAIVVGVISHFYQLENGLVEPTGGERTNLSFVGNGSYAIDPKAETVTIAADQISNSRSTGESGSIRLALYVTDQPYDGHSISGPVALVSIFEPLKPGWYYHNVRRSADLPSDFFRHEGVKYPTLVLLERVGGRDVIEGSLRFGPILVQAKDPWWKFWSSKRNLAQPLPQASAPEVRVPIPTADAPRVRERASEPVAITPTPKPAAEESAGSREETALPSTTNQTSAVRERTSPRPQPQPQRVNRSEYGAAATSPRPARFEPSESARRPAPARAAPVPQHWVVRFVNRLPTSVAYTVQGDATVPTVERLAPGAMATCWGAGAVVVVTYDSSYAPGDQPRSFTLHTLATAGATPDANEQATAPVYFFSLTNARNDIGLFQEIPSTPTRYVRYVRR